MKKRKEEDSLGVVWVPEDRFYGAQTARSLHNFPIGSEKIPYEIIEALLVIKKHAAFVNQEKGLLSNHKKKEIVEAASFLLQKKEEKHFPLSVWQTGSGTQTNMNVNEVIAHLANRNGKEKVHPNDDVNLCQSSNDVFPSALHIAAYLLVEKNLIPSIKKLHFALKAFEKKGKRKIKVGRTHLMDATFLTIEQEFSGYTAQIENDLKRLSQTKKELLALAIGGTAVGTGVNSFSSFSEKVCKRLQKELKAPFHPAKNRFQQISSKQALTSLSGELRLLASDLFKIANDIRFYGSGPRCGLNELLLPVNEPGSSIMPGKVNPTQCEALCMLSLQVIGNDQVIAVANSQGQFQLNTYMPLIGYNLLQSIHLLSDGIQSFTKRCLKGLKIEEKTRKENVEKSLMKAAALNQILGYDKASKIVQKATQNNLSLKEAALLEGVEEKLFDKITSPENMIGPNF